MSVTVGAVAPHNLISWDATALGVDWDKYRVYRRDSGAKPGQWAKIGEIDEVADIGADMSTTDAEAYRTQFRDFEAGKTTGRTYDYYVAVVRDDGAESTVSGIESQSFVSAASSPRWWLTSNRYPELNVPLDNVTASGGGWPSDVRQWSPAGRDGEITATPLRRPGVTQTLEMAVYGGANNPLMPAGQALIDAVRERLRHPDKRPPQWCLVSPMGERWYGTPRLGGHDLDSAYGGFAGTFSVAFVETASGPDTAVPWQGPAYLRGDGSTGHVDHGAQTALELKPAESLSVLCLAALRDTATTTQGIIGNRGGANGGWMLYGNATPPTALRFMIDDGTAAPSQDSTTNPWDGVRRVYGAQRDVAADDFGVWVDGTEEASGTDSTTARIGAGYTFNAGARGGDTSEAPVDIVAYVVYRRALSDDEMRQATYALHNHAGFKLPPFAELYVDFRDSDCYAGSGTAAADLSGNGRDGTITGTTVWMPRGG